jgi:hypothetical protein
MNSKNSLAIVALTNFVIMVLYFALREKQSEVIFADAIVIFFQVLANLFLAIVVGIIENLRRNKIEGTKVSTDEKLLDDELTHRKEKHRTWAQSFLLSALLVLLVGFGLCILNNQ